jgi:hypothetical protein
VFDPEQLAAVRDEVEQALPEASNCLSDLGDGRFGRARRRRRAPAYLTGKQIQQNTGRVGGIEGLSNFW